MSKPPHEDLREFIAQVDGLAIMETFKKP